MAKKSTSKTRSAPAVDRAALCSSVDVLAAIKWLEQMSTMALADTLMALDAGNLAAAQAHSERMKLAENMVPWLVGPCDTMITARIEYQTNELGVPPLGRNGTQKPEENSTAPAVGTTDLLCLNAQDSTQHHCPIRSLNRERNTSPAHPANGMPC